jgi:putative hydrolase of the HAD superfamily
MTITTVIFDVGGVLLRTEDRRPRTMLADAFGMTYEALENLVFNGESGHAAQRGEVTAVEQWDFVRKTLDLKADEVPQVQNTFFSGDVLDRELLDFVSGLRQDFKTAIITNAFDDVREFLSDSFKLNNVFDPIIVSAEEGMMKPDPRIYNIALEKCGVTASEAVFIDDFPHNVKGAQDVGMHAIWFRSREQVISDLSSLLSLDQQ